MEKEKSAGFVVFYEENGKREYLLIHNSKGHWDFPKGHIEKGENEIDAALRELEEETGIKKVEVIPLFNHRISYYFKENGKTIYKEVVFFLGKVKNKEVKLSFEHDKYVWIPYEEALKRIKFNEQKEVIKKAEEFLKRTKLTQNIS